MILTSSNETPCFRTLHPHSNSGPIHNPSAISRGKYGISTPVAFQLIVAVTTLQRFIPYLPRPEALKIGFCDGG
jgi:hypothetical protein